jgi:hypothetical protein
VIAVAADERMREMNMNKSHDQHELEAAIQATFGGVMLGNGISLSQADIIDRRGKDRDGSLVSEKDYRDLKSELVTSDWTRLTIADLERGNIAHLDAEGLRYYLPALMLSVVTAYNHLSMRVIGTLSALNPRPMSSYHVERYSLLSEMQKHAIAKYLEALPSLVHLDYEDAVSVDRAMAAYWYKFAANPIKESRR